jgi:DNA helicase-4
MDGRGPSARWSRPDDAWVRYCDLSTFRPAPIEEERHRGDEITPAVLRIARDMISRGLQVALLARRHGLPWYVDHRRGRSAQGDELQAFVEHLRSFLPEEDRDRIRASTVHGFKGLEADGIILLDALAGSYPLIHPAWMFLRVFGDSVESIVDEERRLFYVGLTRARRALAIVTESGRVSPFLEATETLERLERLQWSALQPVPSLDGARLDIRVHDAYDVRDQLKNVGYRWSPDGSFWRKHVLAEAFSFEALLEEPWASSLCRILVYREDGTLLHYRNNTPFR